MNWDILGHQWAVRLLRGQIIHDCVRHAYLITGSQGVGRRTLALRFAQALNCPQPPNPGQGCRSCRTCKQIERMQNPDLLIIEAERQGGILKVDQIRELGRSLALAPYESLYKIALLLRFEEANPNASNALLKTLEEPASQVVIIITAESVERLLPTIVSRCEVLRLRQLSRSQLAQGLQEKYNTAPETAKLLSHVSGGRPGYALTLQKEPELLEQRKSWLDEHAMLLSASLVKRFVYADKFSKDRDKILPALLLWLSLWRDVLIRATGSESPLTNLDRIDEINRLISVCGIDSARKMASAIERTIDLLAINVNYRMAIECMMLDMPAIEQIP